MNNVEFNQLMESVLKATSDADRNTALTGISEGVKDLFAQCDTLTETNKKLEDECTTYAKLNQNLILKVNAQDLQETNIGNDTTNNEPTPPTKRSFEDLFKGEL